MISGLWIWCAILRLLTYLLAVFLPERKWGIVQKKMGQLGTKNMGAYLR